MIIRSENFRTLESLGQVELLIFILDGSASMYENNTFDGIRKSDHLVSILNDTLERLLPSSNLSIFRISLIYFSDKIIEEFNQDPGLLDEKYIAVFLFTDGRENIRTTKEVIDESLKLKSMGATLCTISSGNDADEDLLFKIASVANLKQIRRLDIANLLDFLPKEKENYKLFLKGHVAGNINKNISEIIRSFMTILIETM